MIVRFVAQFSRQIVYVKTFAWDDTEVETRKPFFSRMAKVACGDPPQGFSSSWRGRGGSGSRNAERGSVEPAPIEGAPCFGTSAGAGATKERRMLQRPNVR